MTSFAHGGISIKLLVVYLHIINECLSYKFHPYSIQTGHTKVESVVYQVLSHKLLSFHAIITPIYDNHINFEVSSHFWEIWPTVCRSTSRLATTSGTKIQYRLPLGDGQPIGRVFQFLILGHGSRLWIFFILCFKNNSQIFIVLY